MALPMAFGKSCRDSIGLKHMTCLGHHRNPSSGRVDSPGLEKLNPRAFVCRWKESCSVPHLNWSLALLGFLLSLYCGQVSQGSSVHQSSHLSQPNFL